MTQNGNYAKINDVTNFSSYLVLKRDDISFVLEVATKMLRKVAS